MNFSLSDEQRLLEDSVERFVRESYALDQRRVLLESEVGFSESHWRQMAELGWLGAALPEAYGGIGGGPVETMVLMQALGKGLVLEPYFSTVVLGANLVARAGDAAQKAALLTPLVAGELELAFAYVEQQAGFDLHDVETRAERQGDGWILRGHKGVVFGAPSADHLIVSARTAGDTRDRDGIGLFVVARDAPGVGLRSYRTVDGLRAAEVTFDGVTLGTDASLGDPGGALPVIEAVAEHAIAALCAEAVGIMSVLVETTNEYLKTREQFGRPIGSFQVLQHQMADMLIASEESRSMSLVATLRLDATDPRERQRAISGAKHLVGKHARAVGQRAVQLHGGMGMTEEMHVGHYFKRLTMIDILFGDHAWHLDRYAAL